MEQLNERISALISALGLKKTAFADKLNVSQAFVSQLCSGVKQPSDRTIADICREFNVNEHWLRTGEGEMFIKLSRGEEISAFMGDILSGEPDFRARLIAALSRLTAEQWKQLEGIADTLIAEMQKKRD
ncbi:hypothetical protein B5F17_14060 [Butyricicoccus pullicaecorum]|uniref:HTH cro/C1-type domain-containing protein n=1 Tax=Butyricicoccus pullicaecorum TaxID=501571 RepID=A0A1Y4L0A2_9FIRM|nr:helix-turn-helix transcriptional regulator [Butyricicoccus pullicaecorum]OUP50255.1 hypothetical protein B5F17_14060 [Butyricicoccus pullicaecorum]